MVWECACIYPGFNPLTVGAVRSAEIASPPPNFLQMAFQSPHCRGSPFGWVKDESRLGGYTPWFQSPHCRGSPFGTGHWRRHPVAAG